MRRCAICHRPLLPGMCVERTKSPKVTVCLDCMGVRFTEDGRMYYDPDKDLARKRWDDAGRDNGSGKNRTSGRREG